MNNAKNTAAVAGAVALLGAVGTGALIANSGGGDVTVTDTTVAPERTIATVRCPSHGVLPNPSCTPGVTNPSVTQANIQQTICVRGYSKRRRPPVSVTGPIKVQVEKDYGIPAPHPKPFAEEELDHLVSIELGGAVADVKNLWPEPAPSYHQKDAAENLLHKQVCAGKISLSEAQREIATNWVGVFESNGLGAGPPVE